MSKLQRQRQGELNGIIISNRNNNNNQLIRSNQQYQNNTNLPRINESPESEELDEFGFS
jgi:hypothetical protein